MREIIRASAWGGFPELVEELGGEADLLLAAAGLDASQLVEGDRYMPLRAFIECQEIAADRLGRRDFGLLFGQRQRLAMLGPLSIAIMNAPTAREGIEVCSRYMHVHNPAATMSLAPIPRSTRDFLTMTIEVRRLLRRSQNDERAISSIHKSLTQIGGEAYRPREVWFMHERISPLATYKKIFGIAPLFGKPFMGIAIDRSVLDAWQPGRSSQLRSLAESFLRSLAPARADNFTTRVRNMTRGLLQGGECSPEQAAAALGIHARTLQRRLKAEGTTFEMIKDEVRRDMAESLLNQPNVSLSQIALMLDYADASAFSRSCRRWFGEAPRNVRRRMLAQPAARPVSDPARLNPLVVARRLGSAHRSARDVTRRG